MPVITIAVRPVSHEEKKSLISALTCSAAQVTRIPENCFTVLVHELPEEAIGVGGRTLKEVMAALPA